MTLVKRGVKGSPVSAAEYDAVVDQVETNKDSIETLESQINSSEVQRSFVNRAAATTFYNDEVTAGRTPGNGILILLETEKEIHKWDSAEATHKTTYVKDDIEVKTTFDKTDNVSTSTDKAIYDGVQAELLEDTPTAGSTKVVKSGGVKTALDRKEYLAKKIISKNGILSDVLATFFTGAIGLETSILPSNNLFETLGISKAFVKSAATGTSIELYPEITGGNGLVLPKANEYFKWSYYVYSPDVEIVEDAGRLRLLWIGGTQFNSASATMTKIDESGIYLVQGTGQFTGDLTGKDKVWFENRFLKVGGGNFTNENIYITNLTLGYGVDEDFSLENSLLKDLIAIQNANINSQNIEVNQVKTGLSKKRFETKKIISKNGILSPDLPTFFTGASGLSATNLPSNSFFETLGISKAFNKSTSTGTAIELYPQITVSDGLVLPNVNEFFKWSYYVYSPDVEIIEDAGRLKTLWIGGTQFNSASATMTKIDESGIYLVQGTGQFTGDLTGKDKVWFENRFLKLGGGNFANENIYITNLTLGYGVDEDFSLENSLLKDLIAIQESKFNNLPSSVIDRVNNLKFNLAKVSSYLSKYERKDVDAFNQLSILFAGDSIFGRQTEAEMSLTPDTNGGIGNGIDTGHFPPNMYNQLVAYKFLENNQYNDADVKYFNHLASEVTKTGTWTSETVGADKIKLARTSSINSSIEIAFSGASFAKFIYSNYGGNGKTRNIRLEISDDGGSNFLGVIAYGLSSSLVLDANSEIFLPNQDYKFGNICLSGLDENTSYILRVTKIDVSGAFDVWGFETWNNPRLNVIVTAQGGNIASNQLTRWERFYSKMYNNSLVVYELPYLNDLGNGIISNFKGIATTTTTPSGSPITNDFWYASADGVYSNFNNTVAKAGQYLQYNATSWEIGRNTVDIALTNYYNNNKAVFERMAKLNIPVLTLITHNSSNWLNRPFTVKDGLTILRNLIGEYGLPSIDVNYYQNTNGLQTSILSDGTHLNDSGVAMYSNLIQSIFSIAYTDRFVGNASAFIPKKTLGSSSGAGTIDFGFEYPEIPTVRIFGNSAIVISEVTNKDFTVTGTGDFDYEVYIS